MTPSASQSLLYCIVPYTVLAAHISIDIARLLYLDRIRSEGEGGAWCPKDQILKSGNEFLQVDLGKLKVITLVETQGRFGNGQVNQATPVIAELIVDRPILQIVMRYKLSV